ncbi:MAG: nucleotide exchange factor GrpE [Anaerolineales bacterium]
MNEKNEAIDPEEQAQLEDPVEDQEASPEEGENHEEPQVDESPEQMIERLQTEADEYLDGWQRARAEFANYKKRIERERESARERITGEIITRYLGVMDDLERALEKAPENDACKEWVAGVDLIYNKFRSILEAEGVQTIEEEGLRFDPNIHEAISYEDSDEFEEGSVIEVTQRGYKLDDRVLRPAMVRVAK